MITRFREDAFILEQLDEYVGLFRQDFRRSDQARWAGVYLQGLLLPGQRKNIESLAGTVSLPAGLEVEDVAQALQNFVNQSPWDEQKLWRRYRALMAQRLGSPQGEFVLEDLTFVKQGQHSAGVQRQYSTALGRKVNCQLAVSLHYAGPAGYCPLSLRLYLPRKWLEERSRLQTAGVPEEHRYHRTRTDIALELLQEVRAEGLPGQTVVLGAGYGSSTTFRAELTAAGWRVADSPSWPGLAEGQETLRQLGLDHFEGRSWRGFHHHACLVMLAYGFTLAS